MRKKIRVGLADNHLITREGLVALLKRTENITVSLDANNGLDLLKKLKIANNIPDIIILDIDMPFMSGKEALLQIVNQYPKIKVIILSQHYSANLIIEFIKIGAKSFLPKECGIKKLIEAIEAVYEFGHYYDKYLSEILANEIRNILNSEYPAKSKIKLSTRELKVLELLRQNKTNKEIAGLLYISERTVEGIRYNLLHKTGSKNLAALITYALEHNLIA
ncbi:hypothetical protein CNR22_20360 [Sphingobacteriaceae bacterium]|nr:hypothetical protein CNR22_20360 [Sphingobacteriaceae bacterium]